MRTRNFAFEINWPLDTTECYKNINIYNEINPAKPCHLYMFKKEFLISKSFWKAKSDSDTTFYFWKRRKRAVVFDNQNFLSILTPCWCVSLQKSISKLIFVGYTGSKNQVRNRLKIQFVELDFSKLIFQKSSTDQQGECLFHSSCLHAVSNTRLEPT